MKKIFLVKVSSLSVKRCTVRVLGQYQHFYSMQLYLFWRIKASGRADVPGLMYPDKEVFNYLDLANRIISLTMTEL